MDTLEIKHLTTKDLDSTSLSAKNIYTFDDSGKAVNITSALSQLDHIPEGVTIPISINGIKADTKGNIQVPEPIDQSYTAFEVLPTTVDVVVNDDGTVTLMDGETPRSFDKYPGLSSLSAVSTTIPASRTHTFSLRCRITDRDNAIKYKYNDSGKIVLDEELSVLEDGTVLQPVDVMKAKLSNFLSTCDIIIDWGDGNSQAVSADFSKMTPASEPMWKLNKDTNLYLNPVVYTYELISQDVADKVLSEVILVISHTYAEDNCNTPHVIKITGKSYFGFTSVGASKFNLLTSKILSNKLPIRSDISSLAFLASWSTRLTSVDVPENMNLTAINHLFRVFDKCTNLKTVKGFNRFNTTLTDAGFSFSGCTALQYCDYVLPHKIYKEGGGGYGIQQVFLSCSNLMGPVDKFLPKDGFIGYNSTADGKPVLNMSSLFNSCKKLTINDVSFVKSILWDSPRADSFSSLSGTFLNCSDIAVRRYVPEEWGGIEPTELTALTFDDRIAVLEAKVAALEAQAQ